MNIYHVRSESAIVTADLTEIGTLFANWLSGTLAGDLTDDMTFGNIVMRDLTVADGVTLTDTSVNTVPGEVSGESSGNNQPLVLSFRTPYSGRSRRGRVYLPGIPLAGMSSPNVVSGGFATGIATHVVELFDDLQTNGYTPVVASFVTNGAPRVTALLTPIESVVVNTRLDTQRRRMEGAV